MRPEKGKKFHFEKMKSPHALEAGGLERIKMSNSTTASDDFLDPPVEVDGKRKADKPDLTVEELRKVWYAIPDGLDPSHERILRIDSGISPEALRAWRPKSITAEQLHFLLMLGFSKKHGTAMVLPYWDIDGTFVQADFRFDTPVTIAGKKQRYLSTAGIPRRLGFFGPLPPEGDIFLIEGLKKAVSAWSKGLYVIALPGIYGLGLRAKDARKDLSSLDLEGRTVIVVLDSESRPKTKAAVEKARIQICKFLKELGAIPKVVDLPEPEEEGGKTGLDDFLVSGGAVEDLMALVRDPDPDPDWKETLVYSEGGVLRPTSWNVRQILEHDEEFETIARCRFNELSARPELPDGKPIDAATLTEVASQIEGIYKTTTVTFDIVSRTVEMIAVQNPHNAIKSWLESLPRWDGTSRIERLFPVYYGAKDTAYTRAVGKNLLVASVARILSPGCKFDNIVILEGPQGIGKSSSVIILFGGPDGAWATEARAEIGSKDFLGESLGHWAVEISELASLRRSMVETVKRVLSTREDNVRLAYRRDSKKYPRSFLFIGTTNETHYLQDPTGSRRFWPIRCGQIDLEAMKRDRDQLFAEALHYYRAGESWWVVPGAEEETEERYDADAWESLIKPWLLSRWETTTSEILIGCLGIEIGRHDRSHQIRVGHIMKRLKWIRKKVRTDAGPDWKYVPISNMGTHRNNMGTSNNDGRSKCVPISPVPNMGTPSDDLPEVEFDL